MKNLLILSTISLVILLSCSDNTNEPKQGNYSVLTVKVFNNNHEPIKSANVRITNVVTNVTIVNDSTNTSGELKSELLEGEYSIRTSVKDGLVSFYDYAAVQLIAGINKVKEFYPYKNIGNIYLQLINSKNEPIPNINAALLSNIFNTTGFGFNVYNAYAYMTVKSDETGIILFENVPIGYHFGLLAYRDENNYYTPPSNGFEGYTKDQVPLFTVKINL
jgi:hypothetical protein